ncbi:hypothetical protein [Microbacterium sp. NPDC086615]|uniref:hypothetical protein n=1 Tax=Microbacterium sp. NPDC086615 TaxID=3154865 RepID=UPI0034210C19
MLGAQLLGDEWFCADRRTVQERAEEARRLQVTRRSDAPNAWADHQLKREHLAALGFAYTAVQLVHQHDERVSGEGTVARPDRDGTRTKNENPVRDLKRYGIQPASHLVHDIGAGSEEKSNTVLVTA